MYLKVWICKIYLDFGIAMTLLISTNCIWFWRELAFLNTILQNQLRNIKVHEKYDKLHRNQEQIQHLFANF